jgi:hypothetical protein
MTREEAILYLEHTSSDDFNLEEHQIQNRLNAIQFLLEENQELKKQLHEASLTIQEMTEQDIECPSNCEKLRRLKKQLEEWKYHLKCSKEMLDIQGQKGNYDYDEYMLGLYNGMEYIISLFETREPNYINGNDVNFTNSKSQQKEFKIVSPSGEILKIWNRR